MNIVLFFVILLAWCLLFAKLEAEIEGRNGWAKELPTARYHYEDGVLGYRAFASQEWIEVDKDSLRARFYIKYIGTLGGKDFTTYHRVVDLIQLFVAHLAVFFCFFQYTAWWVLEIRAVASLMLIWSIEDTLWFYVNPCAHESGHHKDWIAIFGWKFMEKGMFGNFVGGLVIMTLTFVAPSLWHWLVPYLLHAWTWLAHAWLSGLRLIGHG